MAQQISSTRSFRSSYHGEISRFDDWIRIFQTFSLFFTERRLASIRPKAPLLALDRRSLPLLAVCPPYVSLTHSEKRKAGRRRTWGVIDGENSNENDYWVIARECMEEWPEEGIILFLWFRATDDFSPAQVPLSGTYLSSVEDPYICMTYYLRFHILNFLSTFLEW
jgi:hypothetical protein